jgi:micrococcal nuclease
MKIKTIIICCCLILLFGCNAPPEKKNLFLGEVTRVVSGQALEVLLTGTSEVVKVRIKIETENLLRDRYNRIQGHLWQEQTLISQQLIKSGCVLVNDRYPHSYSKLLMESQEYARLMGYGIWNPKLAMRYTPSQFRSMNKL